ncbi:hypothetical protein LCGC14_1597930 [marine sediment metagenome]|uniref:Uncharacterized protein n=1 Tax=marine sediment metagenome TaxID=412755 RepID=A0A0F9ICF0_9ZZZZ
MIKKSILLSMGKNTTSGGAIMTPSSGSEKAFNGFNHGKGQIDFKVIGQSRPLVQLLPTSIHLKEEGAVDGGPSVAIVMQDSLGTAAFGQLSLNMWNEGLKDIGYKIVKDDDC